MRVQLLAHRFTAGKKAGFVITRDSYSRHHIPERDGLAALESSYSASQFDCPAVKLSRRGKPMPRHVILTKEQLIRTDPSFRVKEKNVMSLHSVSAVHVSPHDD